MSKQLNFAQQMDEVKNIDPRPAKASAPRLLRALLQRRAGTAVPVF